MTAHAKSVHAKFGVDRLAERLRKAGLRLTSQRLAIFQALKNSDSHPTVEAIYRAVRKRFPRMSRNTVYLNLETLKRAGETTEVWVGHDAARFEPNSTRHDHVVCIGCKKIVDIIAPAFQRLKVPRALGAGFEVLNHRVDFYGFCKACKRRKGPRSMRRTHTRRD